MALLTCRQSVGQEWTLVGVSENITDFCRLSNKTKECGYIFPLYVFSTSFNNTEKVPNFSETIYNAVCERLGMKPSPEQMFYYIYAVLHSRSYREMYKEFLKIDFPRIPYPNDKESFERLAHLGGKLVEMHLMRHSENWDTEHGFPVAGSNMVETIRYNGGRIYINGTQYFSNVDEREWLFMMGSYQPAQKWLKDRKDKSLRADDIVHYEQMLYAIRHTLIIMDEIDDVI